MKEIYCNCSEFSNKKSRWIANVSKDAYIETQCPSCKECVTIKYGEFKSSTPMALKFSKKR